MSKIPSNSVSIHHFKTGMILWGLVKTFSQAIVVVIVARPHKLHSIIVVK